MTAQEKIEQEADQANSHFSTPIEQLYKWEKENPNALYMSQPYGDGKIVDFTWKQVADQSRRMAQYLKSLDLEPGSHIAILSKNCAHWIMSDLAIWLAGHVSVPLYPTLTADTIRAILDHSESKALFVGKLDGWEDMKPGVPDDMHCISYPLSPPNDFTTWDDIIQKHEPLDENPVPDPSQVATIIYTSGTTGMPKGVVHTHGGIAEAANKATHIYEISSEDRILSYLPLSHVAERMCVELASLYQGMQVYFAESLDTFVEDLKRASPTIFFAVPRIWTKFYMGVLEKMPQKKLDLLLKIPILSGVVKKKILSGLGLENVRLCLSGAAPIPHNLLQWYKKLGLEILEVYGMTENMAYSHSTRSGEVKVGYVGRSNPGVVTKIDEESGEILVKSPSTMFGYYKQPDKTAETLTEDGFLRTGDVGEIDEQGSLRITGRIKEIFKTSKGKYVAPAPIENKLLEDANLEQVCVTGDSLPQPIGLAMLSEQAQEQANSDPKKREEITRDLESLVFDVNKRVDKHENLKTLVVVKDQWATENGFMTPTLKIKRNVIDDVYGDRFEKWFEKGDKVIWED